VTSIEITARLRDAIVAWPEGSSYLGFIFAHSGKPEDVEEAMRAAHEKLQFSVIPELPVGHPAAGKLPVVRDA